MKVSTADKAMTIAEIEAQFESEWVLLDEPQTNQAHEIQGGTVLYHSRDRDMFDRKVLEFHPKRFAVLFTGRPQEGMESVL